MDFLNKLNPFSGGDEDEPIQQLNVIQLKYPKKTFFFFSTTSLTTWFPYGKKWQKSSFAKHTPLKNWFSSVSWARYERFENTTR